VAITKKGPTITDALDAARGGVSGDRSKGRGTAIEPVGQRDPRLNADRTKDGSHSFRTTYPTNASRSGSPVATVRQNREEGLELRMTLNIIKQLGGPTPRTMYFVTRKIDGHLVGHCDCCSGYRSLMFYDPELGNLCFRCNEHLMVADIELNFGGYGLCRPQPVTVPSEK